MTPARVMEHLNTLAGSHGIGRDDIVENRFVGMKSRGCYETPAGTVMLKGHRAMESLTLDREATHLKDELMPRYAKLVYNGFWWSPEREMLQAMVDASQKTVNGRVRLKLYKGNVIVEGRESDSDSLFDVQPAGCGGFHQAQCPASAHCGGAKGKIVRRTGMRLGRQGFCCAGRELWLYSGADSKPVIQQINLG